MPGTPIGQTSFASAESGRSRRAHLARGNARAWSPSRSGRQRRSDPAATPPQTIARSSGCECVMTTIRRCPARGEFGGRVGRAHERRNWRACSAGNASSRESIQRTAKGSGASASDSARPTWPAPNRRPAGRAAPPPLLGGAIGESVEIARGQTHRCASRPGRRSIARGPARARRRCAASPRAPARAPRAPRRARAIPSPRRRWCRENRRTGAPPSPRPPRAGWSPPSPTTRTSAAAPSASIAAMRRRQVASRSMREIRLAPCGRGGWAVTGRRPSCRPLLRPSGRIIPQGVQRRRIRAPPACPAGTACTASRIAE